MKIAVCDNDRQIVEQLKSILISCTKEYRGIEIFTYFSGEEILHDYQKKGLRFEIIFLDIKMNKLDGIQTAEALMKMQSSSLIFFVSAYMDYVFKGYEVRAFRYILKPFNQETIKKHFLFALRELQDEEKRYSIHTKSTILTYNPDDVIYLESSKRQVFVYTVSGKASFYSKLSIEEEKLKGFGFLRVHQGYLVNMAFIKTIIDNNLILNNDVIIPISKSKKKEALNYYTKYLTEFVGILR